MVWCGVTRVYMPEEFIGEMWTQMKLHRHMKYISDTHLVLNKDIMGPVNFIAHLYMRRL